MKTRYETMTTNGIDNYRNFIGDDTEYKDWYNIIGQSRDSGARARSNFRIALNMLGGESDNVRVERFGHWGVGWIEEIYVKPNTEQCVVAERIVESLGDYLILDEDDFSREEWEEAKDVWKNCYTNRERVDYIRKHRIQFEFHDFRDLINCVRGNSFNGYCSELLN